MTTWTNDELNKIGSAEELQIGTLRRDGTARKPVTIWVVRLDDDLYVRSYKGNGGAWFRAARANPQGNIQAGGVDKAVTFMEETASETNDRIDAAYQTKYSRYPEYVPPMVTGEARATTLKLVPR